MRNPCKSSLGLTHNPALNSQCSSHTHPHPERLENTEQFKVWMLHRLTWFSEYLQMWEEASPAVQKTFLSSCLSSVSFAGLETVRWGLPALCHLQWYSPTQCMSKRQRGTLIRSEAVCFVFESSDDFFFCPWLASKSKLSRKLMGIPNGESK